MVFPLLRVIGRVACAALVVMGAVGTGCAPRDPLDRVVQAHNPAELREWLGDFERDAGSSLGHEVRQVFMLIISDTPRFRQPASEFEMLRAGDPLCRRVNGRPLREVMIDGYSAAIETLSIQNGIDSDNLLRLATVIELEREAAFNARLEAVKAGIAEREERMRTYRDRIGQLRKPGA